MKNETPIERVLKLLFYLNTPFGYSLDECLAAIDISKSTFYEYLAKLRELGFCIESEHGKYSLISDKSENEWFTKLFHISEEDAFLFAKAIDKLDVSVPKAMHLKQRLLKVFDSGLFAEQLVRQTSNCICNKLIEAIKTEKQVLLCNYHSGNSQTVANRMVEPFALSDSFNLVWCYDIEKKANRQFKVARINDVKQMPFKWENKIYHKTTPTDVFRNTGLLDKQIEIKLNLRAHNLLIEEYPLAERYAQANNNGWYSLKCNVALYEGPCRFVLGLWNDVEIVGSNEFIAFVENEIENFKIKNTSPEKSD